MSGEILGHKGGKTKRLLRAPFRSFDKATIGSESSQSNRLLQIAGALCKTWGIE